jgi:nitroimidazol reductase NimA-like FMN-containing flavoprotein (pyridoxamine 5'-phosphate oxidase superfamily)
MAAYSVELSDEECWRLLGSRSIGRVAFWTDDGPQIYPLNYVVDSDRIVLRVSAYGPLIINSEHGEVAFEVDEVDGELHTGWSLIAVGTASVLEGDEAHEMSNLRRLQPWAGGSRSAYVAIAPRRLTGRKFGTSD